MQMKFTSCGTLCALDCKYLQLQRTILIATDKQCFNVKCMFLYILRVYKLIFLKTHKYRAKFTLSINS